jgi:hypothetical protein
VKAKLTNTQRMEIERRLARTLDRWSGVGHTVEAARLHIEAEFSQELHEDHHEDNVKLGG